MNTTEILNKTLAWLYVKDQETPGNIWDITGFLNTIGQQTMSQVINQGLAQRGLPTFYRYENKNSFQLPVTMNGMPQVAPEEIFILTQIVLNMLNSEPDKHHDLAELPGLENKEWSQLIDFALFLLKQGWIEAKICNDKLYVKLTIKGCLHLKNHDIIA